MSTPSIHPQSIVGAVDIGEGSTVAAFSRISSGAVLGRDVKVEENVSIGPDVTLDDRVVVQGGAQVWGSVRIGAGAIIGPNVTFAPGSPDSDPGLEQAMTVIGPGAMINAGTVVLAGVKVGRKAITMPGSVVTLDVPAHAIAAGNPAQVTGYTDTNNRRLAPQPHVDAVSESDALDGARLMRLTTAVDMRGSLVALEFGDRFPFAPQRFFFVYGVPSRDVRGEHAHRECHQFLVCVNGSVKAVTDDGASRVEHQLDDPSVGLYMPPLTWGTQYAYSSDAILVVFASHSYDPDDYIRDYSAFRAEIDLS
ncbi:MAG: WxcM-like domain-containing protein [Rhodoglobus sp.]